MTDIASLAHGVGDLGLFHNANLVVKTGLGSHFQLASVLYILE